MEVNPSVGTLTMQTDRTLRDSGKTKRQLLLEVSRLRRKLAVLDQDHERELEQAEQIHTVIDLAAFGVLIADADHRIAYVNEHLCKVLGYRSQEMVGQSLTLLSPRSDQDSLRAYAKAIKSVGFLAASEQVLRCKCGANVPFLLAGARIKDGPDSSYEVALTLVDIRERKLIENELKSDEQRYRGMFEDSPISLWEEDFSQVLDHLLRLERGGITDFDAYFEEHPEEVSRCSAMIRIVDVNRETLKLYQAQTKEELLVSLDRIFSEESMPGVKDQFLCIVQGKREYEGEAINLTLRGEKIYVQLKWIVAPEYERSMDKVLVSITDITKRKRLAEEKESLLMQLHRSQRLETIGTLAAGIAHDFNNILTPILGYVDMVREDLSEDSPSRDDLECVLRATHRAKELVQQILTFSQQGDRSGRPMELTPVVEEAVKFVRHSIPPDIRVETEFELDGGTILADPTQIHQIVMNLCTNSYHAMRDSGDSLRISLTRLSVDSEGVRRDPCLGNQCYACLSVHDNGAGMDAQTQEHMFEPFFTTKGVGEGSGLGLSVVHGIVKAYDGVIRVESDPGRGTTVRVFFPLLDHPANQMHPEEAGMPCGTESILFVDDEECIVQLEQKVLTRLGYHVEAFTDSTRALESFREDPSAFDLVVTDKTMPTLDGLELSQRILALRPSMPIILITGFSDVNAGDLRESCGFREVVMKPLVSQELAQAIHRVFNRVEAV